MRSPVFLLALGCCLGIAHAGAAQQYGDHIRVRQANRSLRPIEGVFIRRDSAGIQLTAAGPDDGPVAIPSGAIAGVDLRRQVGRQTAIGFLVGTGVGLLTGLTVVAADRDYFYFASDRVVAGSTLAGAILGGLIGTAIPRYAWVPADAAPRTSMLIAPGAGGVQVGVRTRF